MSPPRGALLFAGLLACAAPGCSREAKRASILVGAGATLPYPLIATWANAYAEVDPDVRLHYQPLGSTAGARQLRDGVIDFAATDVPDAALREDAVVVPTTATAVVFAYHLADAADLALGADLIADVLLGKITRWNDPKLRAENPGVALPDAPIVVVVRSDASGSSGALTAWLSSKSPAFEGRIGSATWPRFPTGVGAKGNEGVTAFLKTTPGAIGYVELSYAKRAGLGMARLENRSGARVAPSEKAVADALLTAPSPSALFEASSPTAYPLAVISYLALRNDADADKSKALRRFAWWAIHDGQRVAESLDYVRLTPALVSQGERALAALEGS